MANIDQILAGVISPTPPSKRKPVSSLTELSSVIEASPQQEEEQQSKRIKTGAELAHVAKSPAYTFFDWADWGIDQYIGGGSFGQVWKIHNKRTGEKLAIKFFKEKLTPALERESKIMSWLSKSCPQLVQYKGLVKTSETPIPGTTMLEQLEGQALLMEWVPGSDLWTERKQRRGPQKLTLDLVTVGLLQQLACIHSVGIVHQDISSRNIIFNAPAQSAKLIDYGLGCAFGEQAMDLEIRFCAFGKGGTYAYRAPEVWAYPPHVTPDADIFSLGMVLSEWFLGDDVKRYLNKRLLFPTEAFVSRVQANPQVPWYLKAMLAISPLDRPTAGVLIKQIMARE